MRTTVTALADRLRSGADAWAFLEELRWPNGPSCPRCDGSDVYLIVPKNGVSRRTSSGSMSERRTWQCRPCRRQFSATTGTMMHGSKVPMRTWVLVIFEMCASRNGVAAAEIERKYGLCSRTAWFLMHRIREAMRSDGLVSSMRGTIVADETYIGGETRRMNSARLAKLHRRRDTPWSNYGPHSDKTPVLSLIDAETGEVRSRVIPRVDGSNLRKAIAEQVDMAGSVLWTDESKSYNVVGREFAAHHSVNHQARRWVGVGGASTNKLENFFSQLKRSIDGTYHHVSVEHLNRYLAEFDYRFTTLDKSDGERMADLVGRSEGRRITYKRVTA